MRVQVGNIDTHTKFNKYANVAEIYKNKELGKLLCILLGRPQFKDTEF